MDSWQTILNNYLDWNNKDHTTATSTERATALAELAGAFKKYLRGVYAEEGRRMFHVWSFLHPTSVALALAAAAHATLTSQDIVFTAVDGESAGEDVTVAIAAGTGSLTVAESDDAITITLASGGNTTAQVVAACSALTKATVAGGSATVATALAATHLALPKSQATALPSDFAGIIEDIRFARDAQDSKSGRRIVQISPKEMDDKWTDWDGSADYPRWWCLRPKALSAAAKSGYEIVAFPPPESALSVYLRIKSQPADPVDSASAYPPGVEGCDELIMQLAKDDKERQAGQVQGPEKRESDELFGDCVRMDMELYPVEHEQNSMADEETGCAP